MSNYYGFHKGLFDPILRSNKGMSDDMFRKYIEIFDGNQIGIPTTPGLPTKIKEEFFDSHKDVDEVVLKGIWSVLYDRIASNEAFARFVSDFHGAESDYFFPWLLSVAKSPSEALELSYNAGRNLMGKWVDSIPENDPINKFVVGMPTVAYNRLRQLTVADLVMSERDIQDGLYVYDQSYLINGEYKSKVLDLGAGRMAWARHHGFTFSPAQIIYAVDTDPNINPKELFSEDPKSLGLYYDKDDLVGSLQKNMLYVGATLVILQGVASYFPTEVFREHILKQVYSRLTRNGRFFFDLQIEHISYVWGCKLFGWPQMNMPKTVSEAIDIVEGMLRELHKHGKHFRASYEPDSYNRDPLSVMVTLTKT